MSNRNTFFFCSHKFECLSVQYSQYQNLEHSQGILLYIVQVGAQMNDRP